MVGRYNHLAIWLRSIKCAVVCCTRLSFRLTESPDLCCRRISREDKWTQISLVFSAALALSTKRRTCSGIYPPRFSGVLCRRNAERTQYRGTIISTTVAPSSPLLHRICSQTNRKIFLNFCLILFANPNITNQLRDGQHLPTSSLFSFTELELPFGEPTAENKITRRAKKHAT